MIIDAFLALYRLAWVVLMPLVLVYLWRRGRKDALYWQHLGERFASYPPLPQNPVWIHAVSLGETRSAVPLARALLDQGETIVFTHFTPAGRREALSVFAPEIAAGRVASVWAPLDLFWAYGRFFRACRPKIGLTMEIEIWPAMIFAAKRAKVPFFMCNAQYPNKSLARDSRGLRLRQRIMAGCAGAFVKSQLQADRFAGVGVRNIQITGELRFDQPIPHALLEAADALRPKLAGRSVITLSSVVVGEDALFIDAIKTLRARDPKTLFIYVPRAPERFDTVAQMLGDTGLRVAQRSTVFGSGVEGLCDSTDWPTDEIDVLLGDSLGEMYFYLSLAHKVIAGGGFIPAGAHNIIEALALNKPVATGPNTHTIEYPFVEAEAAGVAKSVPDGPALVTLLDGDVWASADQIAQFMADHAGGSARTLAAMKPYL